MKSNNQVVYKFWNGREVIKTSTPPSESDGQILKFTGVYDKDGEPIFESDIVVMTPFQKDVPPIKGVVEYDEGTNSFGVRHGALLSKLDIGWSELHVVGDAFTV